MHHDPVYSPARQGSASEALQALIVRNPNRRPVLLNIIGLCEGGCPSSVISERVDEWQRDNWSVYAPMTLCRMLERAGALTLEMPDVSEEHESAEEGVAYLEIRETVDPVWRATPEALALRAEYLAGKSFRAVVLGSDEARYAEVYAAVMEALEEAPRTLDAIESLPDAMAKLRVLYPNILRLDWEQLSMPQSAAPGRIAGMEKSTPLELFASFYVQQTGMELTSDEREAVRSCIEEVSS